MRTGIASIAVFLLSAFPAGAGQSFIYVVTGPPAGPACLSPPCPTGQLLVYDAVTAELVTWVPFGDQNNVPRALAPSPDGRRLYVTTANIMGGDASIAVFDTTQHRMLGAYPIAPAPTFAWAATVTADSGRVFVSGSDATVVWNPQSAAVSSTQPTGYVRLLSHRNLDRVVAARFQPPSQAFHALDPVSGAILQAESQTIDDSVRMSLDGSRIYSPFNVYDPVTFGIIGSIACQGCSGPGLALDAPGRNRLYRLTNAPIGVHVFDRSANQPLGSSLVMPGTMADAVVAGDESTLWVTRRYSDVSPHSLSVVDLARFAVVRTIPLTWSPYLIASTPAGAGRCSYEVNVRQSSWAVAQGGVVNVTLSTGCDWVASTTASWLRLPPNAASGSGTRTFEITVDPYYGGDASRSAAVILGGQVVRFTQAGFGSQPAYGSFDTPGDNTTGITGSLSVTGWALDDVGVTRVRIFRDPVAGEPGTQIYIGDATFVDGARPDVAAIFPSAPFATRAGWGYLMLTNVLPNNGDGTYRIHAFADDVDGHTTLLGSKTISCSNSTATLPFGAIDTPGQGETVSGTIVNWGWVLTPPPGTIPADGSTIDVIIDGVVAGQPTYGIHRPDVAALFPAYANTNGAGGYFTIDTTTLSNGLHSIAWVVRDNLGRAQGIGSRYFTVINP
jgi:hypothetical protein